LGEMEMLEKAAAVTRIAIASACAKTCASTLISDLNNCKDELFGIKETASSIKELLNDKAQLKEIGQKCRDASANSIKECFDIIEPSPEGEGEDVVDLESGKKTEGAKAKKGGASGAKVAEGKSSGSSCMCTTLKIMLCIIVMLVIFLAGGYCGAKGMFDS